MPVAPAAPITLDPETLDFLFPCHFAVDAGQRMTRLGPGLRRLLPRAAPGANVSEAFEIIDGPSDLDLAAATRRQIVLRARGERPLRLRGAIAAQAGGALFLVSPAPTDGAEARALGLDLGDLSPCDGSLELVIANEMQRIITLEASELAARLKVARDVAVQREAFFQRILQLMPAIVVVKDAVDGRYLLVNARAEQALGLSAEQMIGRTPGDLFPAEQAEDALAEDARLLAGDTLELEQIKITTTPLGDRVFATRKLIAADDAGGRHIVTVGEDVTEQQQAGERLRLALEAAEQANAAKSTFLANMSHEIRTPLNGIVAVADVLSRADLGRRERELVGMIRTSGATLERLLGDILDLARIESRQLAVESAPFDLPDLCRATADLVRLRADEKGVALDCHVAADLGNIVVGDAVRVRQILGNLLGNAVKFTDRGRVALKVERLDTTRVRFCVTDTGVGLSNEGRARIFERFQQADESITRRYGGTGLGLAICRELTELMGGTLGCESVQGVGSTFTVELPLAVGAGAGDDGAAPALEATPPGDLRVLVADDHPTNRRVVELMLEDIAQVVCVEDGRQAIDAVLASDFDVILMDMQMPVMDGLAAVQAIRDLPPAKSQVPIVMLTANALPEHVAASAAVGANVHLSKPITAEALFSALGAVL